MRERWGLQSETGATYVYPIYLTLLTAFARHHDLKRASFRMLAQY